MVDGEVQPDCVSPDPQRRWSSAGLNNPKEGVPPRAEWPRHPLLAELGTKAESLLSAEVSRMAPAPEASTLSRSERTSFGSGGISAITGWPFGRSDDWRTPGVVAWSYQLVAEWAVTGNGAAAYMGLYIVDFVFWIGISHAGNPDSRDPRMNRCLLAQARDAGARPSRIRADDGAVVSHLHLGRAWRFTG